MGVYIHGIDAPKGCAYCFTHSYMCFFDVEGGYRNVQEYGETKPDWCPMRQLNRATYQGLKDLEEAGFEL